MQSIGRTTLSLSLLALGCTIAVAARRVPAPRALAFEELEIIVETNATDQDAEIVIASKTEDGIRRMVVHDPSLTPILDMTSADAGSIGLAQIEVESAEPDIRSVLAAYPEGEYRFSALTVNGEVVRGRAELSHDLLSAPDVLEPRDGDVLDADAVEVIWSADPRAAGYELEIEGEDMTLTLELAPDVERFAVPAELLEPASTYQIGLKVEGKNGNLVGVELEIYTLP